MNGYTRLARNLMDQHGLHDWKIAWSRAKKTHGLCNHGTKTLTFSAAAAAVVGEAEVRDTIIHEIAHALVGPGHGHDSTWLARYRGLGGTGGQYVSKTAAAAVAATAAWEGRCPKGHSAKMHRAPLVVKTCGQCGGGPQSVMTWYQHGRKVDHLAVSSRYANQWRQALRQYGNLLPR